MKRHVRNAMRVRVLGLGCALGALGLIGQASAGIADTPLSLAVSQTLTYDSNVRRVNTGEQRDLISTTGMAVSFDKDYGRQNYRGSAKAILQRYKNSKDSDNDGYEANLGFSTDVAARGFLSVDTSSSRSLQDYGEQFTTRVKNVITSSDTSINGRYTLAGRWAATADYDHTRVDNSSALFDDSDRTSNGLRAGLQYSFTDRFYLNSGIRKSKYDYSKRVVVDPTPNASGFARSILGEEVDRTDIDVQMGYSLPGFSTISGRLGWAKEKHTPDAARDFKGLTWNFNWNYVPAGKLVYNVGFGRDTNNSGQTQLRDRSIDLGIFQISGVAPSLTTSEAVNTSLNASVSWRATYKLSSTLGFRFRKIDQSSTFAANGASVGLTTIQDARYEKSLTTQLVYNFDKNWQFSCSMSVLSQTKSDFSTGYNAETAACTGTLSLN